MPEPSQSIDEALRQIWRAVLNVADVGPDDNLVDMGGSSLTAMRLTAQISAALGVDVPMYVVLGDTTFGALVAAIRDLKEQQSASA